MSGTFSRIQLTTLIAFAGFGGVAAAGMGLFVYKNHQNRLRVEPYFRGALDILHMNKRAVEMIGKPIGIGLVNISRPGTIFEPDQVDLAIPLTGKRKAGHLCVKAHRDPETEAWILDRIDFTAEDDSELKGKTFIIFKRNPVA